jgi:hypothetical protein
VGVVAVQVDVALRIGDLRDAIVGVAHEGHVEAGGAGNAVWTDGQPVTAPVLDGLRRSGRTDCVGGSGGIGVDISRRIVLAAIDAEPQRAIGNHDIERATFGGIGKRSVEARLGSEGHKVPWEDPASECRR